MLSALRLPKLALLDQLRAGREQFVSKACAYLFNSSHSSSKPSTSRDRCTGFLALTASSSTAGQRQLFWPGVII